MSTVVRCLVTRVNWAKQLDGSSWFWNKGSVILTQTPDLSFWLFLHIIAVVNTVVSCKAAVPSD